MLEHVTWSHQTSPHYIYIYHTGNVVEHLASLQTKRICREHIFVPQNIFTPKNILCQIAFLRQKHFYANFFQANFLKVGVK